MAVEIDWDEMGEELAAYLGGLFYIEMLMMSAAQIFPWRHCFQSTQRPTQHVLAFTE
jgi:hypothetical protein